MEKYIPKSAKNDVHFVVSLDGLKLSKDQIARIDKRIKDMAFGLKSLVVGLSD